MENYTVYGKDNCPYCDNTVNLLEMRSKEFTYLSLDKDYDKQLMIDYLFDSFAITPRTFPQIVMHTEIGDTYIGGFDNLLTHLNK